MTGKARRFAQLLRGEKPDAPVVFPMVVANHAARIEGYSISEAVTDADVLARVLYSAYRFYGYDLVMVFTDTMVEAEAMGAQVVIPDDDDPFLLEPPRVSKLEAAVPDKDGRMPVVLEATRRLAKLLDGEAPVLVSLKGPFSLASFLRGIEGFLADLIDQPARARDFLKLALENQMRYAEAIIKAGGVPFIGDPVASGSMVGSSIFRDFARPFLSQLVDVIHESGSRCGLHICGETRHILKEMAATRADLLSLDETDLRAARAEVGPSAVLMGNVSTHLVLEGTADKVAAAARVCLETGGPNLLLSTSCDVPPDAPKENVQAIVQAGRQAT
jgi:uroporphyrinogen decarboxylase